MWRFFLCYEVVALRSGLVVEPTHSQGLLNAEEEEKSRKRRKTERRELGEKEKKRVRVRVTLFF
jgi:hypothetical protein